MSVLKRIVSSISCLRNSPMQITYTNGINEWTNERKEVKKKMYWRFNGKCARREIISKNVFQSFYIRSFLLIAHLHLLDKEKTKYRILHRIKFRWILLLYTFAAGDWILAIAFSFTYITVCINYCSKMRVIFSELRRRTFFFAIDPTHSYISCALF